MVVSRTFGSRSIRSRTCESCERRDAFTAEARYAFIESHGGLRSCGFWHSCFRQRRSAVGQIHDAVGQSNFLACSCCLTATCTFLRRPLAEPPRLLPEPMRRSRYRRETLCRCCTIVRHNTPTGTNHAPISHTSACQRLVPPLAFCSQESCRGRECYAFSFQSPTLGAKLIAQCHRSDADLTLRK